MTITRFNGSAALALTAAWPASETMTVDVRWASKPAAGRANGVRKSFKATGRTQLVAALEKLAAAGLGVDATVVG